MSAGLPGVGLSGVFFIVSALLMVPLEIVRTLRKQSSLARWATVLRHLAIATAMIVCVELAYVALRLAVDQLRLLQAHPGAGNPVVPHTAIHLLPFAPVLATLGVVCALLLAAKAAQLISRWRKTGAAAIIRACFATFSPRWLRVPPRASASPAPSREA
jgi:hypothetical protein